MRLLDGLILSMAIAASTHAATYERPAGAYTPGTFTENTTKYQDDSQAVPRRAISSVKIDGDINKAFDGLNELDVRLMAAENTLSSTIFVTPTLIQSGTTFVRANSSGGISFTTAGVNNAYLTGSGLLVAAGLSSTASISATSLYAPGNITSSGIISGSSFGPVLTSLVSATAGHVTSATIGTATAGNITAGSISNSLVAIGSAIISTTASSCSVLSYAGVFSGTCTRVGQGLFSISTTTMPNLNYKPSCNLYYGQGGTGLFLGAVGSGGGQKRLDGFSQASVSVGGGAVFIDSVQFTCVIYP